MKATVAKRVSFDAAHYLPNYEGKCKNMHGHHWVVELGVEGEVGVETGMVVDFTHLGDFLRGVKKVVDHGLVNDTIPNPTAENIADWVKQCFLAYQKGNRNLSKVRLAFIRVWETEDSYAEVKGE